MKLYGLKDSQGWMSITLQDSQETAESCAEALCEAIHRDPHYTVEVLIIDTDERTMVPGTTITAKAKDAAPHR